MGSRLTERRFKTYPNRWGDGNVHRYYWDSLNKCWYVPCRGCNRQPHGEVIEKGADLTCKLCARGDHRWP